MAGTGGCSPPSLASTEPQEQEQQKKRARGGPKADTIACFHEGLKRSPACSFSRLKNEGPAGGPN